MGKENEKALKKAAEKAAIYLRDKAKSALSNFINNSDQAFQN